MVVRAAVQFRGDAVVQRGGVVEVERDEGEVALRCRAKTAGSPCSDDIAVDGAAGAGPPGRTMLRVLDQRCQL